MPFSQTLRYAKKIILGILTICLRYFFSQALILEKNAVPGQPHVFISCDVIHESPSININIFPSQKNTCTIWRLKHLVCVKCK
ncbi:MAG: hypothetical protein B1H11_09690 [Desulfobacteraceae bacterium 4484_190.1]|nr:MAG: hypothetical protein B1H11_09690 [Desulfobacteraceae bacterium 4484_190.1]